MPKKTEKTQENPKITKRAKEVANLRLMGKSMAEIAAELHVTKTTVFRDLQRKDVKNTIEETVKYLSVFAPLAREGHVELMASVNPKVRYKAIEMWYKVMGLTGIQAPTFIQNIYNTQNNMVFSPQLQKLLARALPTEVINVTPYKDVSKEAYKDGNSENIDSGVSKPTQPSERMQDPSDNKECARPQPVYLLPERTGPARG